MRSHSAAARSFTQEYRFRNLPGPVVRELAQYASLDEAWNRSSEPQHRLYVAAQCVGERGSVTHRQVVRVTTACALTVLFTAPEGDDRPRLALASLDQWTRGSIPSDELTAARRFLWDSLHDQYSAVGLAALSAFDAAGFDRAGDVYGLAPDAASATVLYAVHARSVGPDKRRRELADLIRASLPVPPHFQPGGHDATVAD